MRVIEPSANKPVALSDSSDLGRVFVVVGLPLVAEWQSFLSLNFVVMSNTCGPLHLGRPMLLMIVASVLVAIVLWVLAARAMVKDADAARRMLDGASLLLALLLLGAIGILVPLMTWLTEGGFHDDAPGVRALIASLPFLPIVLPMLGATVWRLLMGRVRNLRGPTPVVLGALVLICLSTGAAYVEIVGASCAASSTATPV